MRFSVLKPFLMLTPLSVLACLAHAQTPADPLKAGFADPPLSARPQVWWHWMNGNITEEGIKLDLEWMKRTGIGGFHNFDAALETPTVVPKRLVYMTPEWKDAFRYAINLADQLGLKAGIAGSPGWSESGGPWVPAQNGMKKYVWSEVAIAGGKPFHGRLPQPPTETGPFQGIATHETFGGSGKMPTYYRDSAVIAFRRAATDVPLESLHPTMSASGGSPDFAALADGDLVKTTAIPVKAPGEKAWIEYAFDRPVTLRAVTLVMHEPDGIQATLMGVGPAERALETSDDGHTFTEAVQLPRGEAAEQTISFPAVTARYFRVTFKATPPAPLPNWAQGLEWTMHKPAKAADYEIAELVLHPGARVNRWQEKAAFATVGDLYGFATPASGPADAIATSDVVNLAANMQPDGTLNWTPPAGDWIVLRLGYSLLGITNHPATPEATGLEVDKLDGAAVKDYFEKYLDNYRDTVGADMMGRRGISFVINDSWEAGAENWTGDMIARFTTLRGYDPTPWLPVLTGRIVGSAAQSDRFLWDLRKTISDLTATQHYGQLEAVLHERNMIHYGESHEGGRALIADGMEVKKYNEVPMSAMWTQTPGVNHEQFGYNADDRESASVAHIYGQNIAAAESLTAAAAPWAWSPQTLKPTADQELLNGINRIVIHESAHQPLINKAPGMTLGPFGQWFNRNETWAEQAKPWVSYLARSSFLLQQGRFAADVVYFYGEDSNLTAIFEHTAPPIPPGYGFDYINADALIHELSASNGMLHTHAGMNYRVLALDSYSRHMSLPVLQAIYKLVSAGAIVAGPKPIDDPSLADDQAAFQRLSAELFGDGTGTHKVGAGTVYAGQSLDQVFSAIALGPDFEHSKPLADTRILFVHRKLSDGEIYFLDNRKDRNEAVEASFRVAGKVPELWHAEDGRSEPVSYRIADGRTTIPLKFEPWGTVFVVFRKPAKASSFTLPDTVETRLATLSNAWDIAFQPGRGAPASTTLQSLASWSDNADPGVKYFSGTGTYSAIIHADAGWFKPGAHLWIDLGDVKNLAEVSVNGKPLGQVWHPPFRFDVTRALRPGANRIEVRVTNAWVNRLIGDEQPGVTQKITFADVKPYKADSKLLPSGLLGPVTILSVSRQDAEKVQ